VTFGHDDGDRFLEISQNCCACDQIRLDEGDGRESAELTRSAQQDHRYYRSNPRFELVVIGVVAAFAATATESETMKDADIIASFSISKVL
jgi:hypothetical protein